MNEIEEKLKFLEKIKKVHGNRYSYDKSIYTGRLDKMIITCKEHGDFLQSPKKHLCGQGCTKCGREVNNVSRRMGLDKFIEECKITHNNFYDYSEVSFLNLGEAVSIVCPIHGSFSQSAISHKNGVGCAKCWGDRRKGISTCTLENFIKKAKDIHGELYDYSNSKYISAKTHVEIICKKHGSFFQTPDVHLSCGCGCPSCAHTFSRAQNDLSLYIKSLGITVVDNFKLANNKEVDIYCPDLKIGFEYNGLRYHSEKFRIKEFHIEKTLSCEKEGIRLIHIWEDEWITNEEKTKRFILTKLGKTTEKYSARKCEIKKVPWKETSEFLEEYHMQSSCAPTKFCYGLYYMDQLVSVMCFTSSTTNSTENSKEIELIRFCSKGVVRGGFSKLLSYFINNSSIVINKIVSFSDKRISNGEIYLNSGFIKEKTLPPTYCWYKGVSRFHRRGFQHQYLKTKFQNYDPEKTEVENCHANGYLRIWDCGMDKWVLNISNPTD